jgi:hypothetical protein
MKWLLEGFQFPKGRKNKASQTHWPFPIDKLLYIYKLCPQSEHQNNPFQSKQSKHFHQENQFILCETGF